MKKFLSISISLILLSFYSFSTNYEVGTGKTYANISDAPLETLKAGDTLKIYYRATPYKEKFVLGAAGTEADPVVIIGIPSSTGLLPVIDGDGAKTRTQLDYWNEVRAVIKIGGTNIPSDNASWIVIQNLEVKNGKPGFTFTDHAGSVGKAYVPNAASIWIEKGEHITIRGCKIHDSGNGFFVSSQSSEILVEKNEIYSNGNVGSIYEHNVYTEAIGIIFQYNTMGPLCAGCSGNNLKDRSAGTVIRYNKIEGGNRQLDLVESDYTDFVSNPIYNKTYVYGNLLIEPSNDGNAQICHYGGDQGNEANYRKGTLYFYDNTVISKRTSNTTLFRLSSNGETADVRNNVFYVSNGGSSLGIVDETGTALLRNNWLNTGWKKSHSNAAADVQDISGNITGTDPKFKNSLLGDYAPAEGSALIGAAGSLGTDLANYPPLFEPLGSVRSAYTSIGAFEYKIISNVTEMEGSSSSIIISPNPFQNCTSITLDFQIEGKTKIIISDLSGRVILEDEKYSVGKDNSIFDWNNPNLKPGIYLIHLQTEKESLCSKIIKL